MQYSFSHCAENYEQSRQRDRCPSDKLIRRLIDLGVRLDSVIDFGSGTGYWLDVMRKAGHAQGLNIAVDVSPEMLAVAEKRLKSARLVLGGIEELDSLNIEGADCIFMCMVAHLLNFPEDIVRLVSFARQKRIPHIVLLEEVSFLYQAMVGNSHYIDHLPEPIRKAISAYLLLRQEYGKPNILCDRDAPFPTPSMSLDAWKRLGVGINKYHFEAPSDIAWVWSLSAKDIVGEIYERSVSTYFCHSPEEAIEIADKIASLFEPINGGDFTVKYELPFWFNLHVFDVF